MPAPEDALEFALWIAALRDPKLSASERDAIMAAIYDLFEPEED